VQADALGELTLGDLPTVCEPINKEALSALGLQSVEEVVTKPAEEIGAVVAVCSASYQMHTSAMKNTCG
jgi:hypothetical protein